jgi:hypothetical protein
MSDPRVQIEEALSHVARRASGDAAMSATKHMLQLQNARLREIVKNIK